MLPELTSKYMASPRAPTSIRPRSGAPAADPAGRPKTMTALPVAARVERATPQRPEVGSHDGLLRYLAGLTGKGDRAPVHDVDVVGQLEGLGDVLLDEEHR